MLCNKAHFNPIRRKKHSGAFAESILFILTFTRGKEMFINMQNDYTTTPTDSSENFEFPEVFIKYFNTLPRMWRDIYAADIRSIGKEAFYKKLSNVASYQLFIGILSLNQYPDREKFWSHYNNTKPKGGA